MNPIRSFFAAPARSNLREPKSHVEHFQTAEDFESGASSRTPSSNNLEEMAGYFSDDINDEGGGILQTCSSEDLGSCRNHFPADDDRNSDADVKCTPAFGSPGSPVRRKNPVPLFESDSCNSDQNHCVRGDDSGSPCEYLEPTLMQCSPVEHSISAPSESETCSAVKIDSQHVDSKLELSSRSDVRFNTPELKCSREPDEKASRVVQLRLAFSPSKQSTSEMQNPPSTGTKSTSSPKLKELWQRNVATQAQGSVKRGASSWEYKQEEVDEEVLAQLPIEIQQELRNSLKLHRRLRPMKHPSISDFFPSAK